jgi:hypothetical protein
MQKVNRLIVVIVLVGIASTAACQPREIELPFETVAEGELLFLRNEQGGGIAVEKPDPDFFIAVDLMDVQQIADTLNPDRPGLFVKHLVDVDYDRYIAVLAYYGQRGMSGYKITIEKITQVGDVVQIFVSTVDPTVGTFVFITPFHAVQIEKKSLSRDGELVFRIIKNGEILVETQHFVP